MKKLFVIAFGLLAMIACSNDEPQPQKGNEGNSSVVLKSSNPETGEICVQKNEFDTCYSIGRSFNSVSIVKGEIVVKVGEGENVHDSIITIYEPIPVENRGSEVPSNQPDTTQVGE